MKVTEIITNPPRDEYIDDYSSAFADAAVVAKIKDLVLKRVSDSGEVQYGLFSPAGHLVGYLSLYYYGKGIWVVALVQLAQAYKGQGFGTFLYDYAVMNDKMKIMSDASNTGGVNGSESLWRSLYQKKRYPVVGFNTSTGEILPDATPDTVYNNKTNIRWIALPESRTINEAITEIQLTMSKRFVVWYGPGTTTDTYFNF